MCVCSYAYIAICTFVLTFAFHIQELLETVDHISGEIGSDKAIFFI